MARLSTPTSARDLVIRTVKTAVAAAVAVVVANGIDFTNLSALKVTGIAAGTAAVTALLNGVLVWTNS